MLYEKLMMDTTTFTKFTLFKQLTSVNRVAEYSIMQLSEDLSLNYQRTASTVTELDKELALLNPEQTSLLRKPGKIDLSHLLVSIDEYRYFLLKQSVPFQYILYILNHSQPNIDDFCQRYFVSRSTFSRKIARLKVFLKQFKLHFAYANAGLLGDERVVRGALFNLIWLGTRGIFWPFAISRKTVKPFVTAFAPYFPLSQTFLGQIELEYLAAICLSRTRNKAFATYDPRYDFLMKDNSYYDFDLLERVLKSRIALTPMQLKGESGTIFFFSHYAPFYTLEDKETFRQTLANFSRKPNMVTSFVKEFLAEAEKNIFTKGIPIQNFLMLKGNLLNLTFIYYVLGQNGPTLQALIAKPRKKTRTAVFLEAQLKEFFNKQSKKAMYSFLQPIKTELIHAYHRVLLPFYEEPAYLEHLKVGLSFEHSFSQSRKMYQFFDHLGFVDSSTYCETENTEYDLVISSSLLPVKKNPWLPLYLWDLSNEDKDFTQLYQKLYQLYMEKNLAS